MSKKSLAAVQEPRAIDDGPRAKLIYHFCRMQLPGVHLSAAKFDEHMKRTFALYQAKAGERVLAENPFDNFYPLDWFIACACLEGEVAAWDHLFAARAGRTDCLLVDALRARAVRLYPRDE